MSLSGGMAVTPRAGNGKSRLWSAALRRWSRAIASASRRQVSDPLSRGGLALLVNTGLTGILGFGYWIMAARLFSTYAVGVAGALIAATTLFSGLGQLNLSGMLMRFLPTAGEKSRRLVLVSYVFAGCVSALLASVSLMGVKALASPASPLRLDAVQSAVFIVAVVSTVIFTIEDNVLVGLRRAFWVPIENGGFGVAKIGALFFLAPIGTGFALFGAWMIPLALTISVISIMLFRRFLPSAPRPRSAGHLGPELRPQITRFAIGDATGGLFTQAWTYILPVLIASMLGPSMNALFYTSFLFSSTIDQVAASYASPLTVEGAHSPDQTAPLIRVALRRIFTIIAPVIAGLLILSPWLLRAFGDKYVKAVPLLALLLIACLPKAMCTVYYAYCRIQRTTHRSAAMQAYVCIATLSAVMLLAHPLGLIGVGAIIVAVQLSAGLLSWWALRKRLRHPNGHDGSQGQRRYRGGNEWPAAFLPSITRK
jgi:O-antigen/teichoic acid export membrane protein